GRERRQGLRAHGQSGHAGGADRGSQARPRHLRLGRLARLLGQAGSALTGPDVAEIESTARERGVRLVRFLWCGNDGTVRAKATALSGLEQRLRSEEHTSELQSLTNLVCRLLLEKKKKDEAMQHRRQHTRLCQLDRIR